MEFETLKTVYGDTPAGRKAAATMAEVNHRLAPGTLRQTAAPFSQKSAIRNPNSAIQTGVKLEFFLILGFFIQGLGAALRQA